MRKTVYFIIFAVIIFAMSSCSGCNPNEPQDDAGPTAVPTPTAVNTPGNTLFNFESDYTDWLAESHISLALSTETAFSGSSSLKGTCTITGTSGSGGTGTALYRYQPSSTFDMTGKTAQFYLYVPSSLAELTNKYHYGIWYLTDTWHYYEMGPLDTEGWLYITHTPSGISENSVVVIALMIYKDTLSPDWSGDLYLDYVSW